MQYMTVYNEDRTRTERGLNGQQTTLERGQKG